MQTLEAAGVQNPAQTYQFMMAAIETNLFALRQTIGPVAQYLNQGWAFRDVVLTSNAAPLVQALIMVRINIVASLGQLETLTALETWGPAAWQAALDVLQAGAANAAETGGALAGGLIAVVAVIWTAYNTGAGAMTATEAQIATSEIENQLQVQAAENEAWFTALEFLISAADSGRLEAEGGLTFDDALGRLQENLRVGRAPFLGILEPRPCPNIGGRWFGELLVRSMRGEPAEATHLCLDERAAGDVQAGLEVVQAPGACTIQLRLDGDVVDGHFSRRETRQLGDTFYDVDAVSATAEAGRVTFASLEFSGPGAGQQTGDLVVALERNEGGQVVSYGGVLRRDGSAMVTECAQPSVDCDAAAWNGVWCSNFGVMTFSASGDQVSGTYEWDQGTLEGRLSEGGCLLTGQWREAPHATDRDWGQISFRIEPASQSWSGTWSYNTQALTGDWHASRCE